MGMRIFDFLKAVIYFPRKAIFIMKNFRKYQNRYSRRDRIRILTQRIFKSKIPLKDYKK